MEAVTKKKITNEEVAYKKAESYCAYQERCQQEIRNKLYEWGLWPDAVENIIVKLINNNFLNEERFAIAFAGGKFRIKKWGRIKIKTELKKRKITDYCIKKAMAQIEEDTYTDSMCALILKKYKSLTGQKALRLQTAARYVIAKGYESDLVWEATKKINQ